MKIKLNRTQLTEALAATGAKEILPQELILEISEGQIVAELDMINEELKKTETMKEFGGVKDRIEYRISILSGKLKKLQSAHDLLMKYPDLVDQYHHLKSVLSDY